MDSRERFSAAAGAYDAGRPSYPDRFLDGILAAAGVPAGARLVDVGCGTGIAARQLAGRGFEVVGVEPNPAMRAEAIRQGGPRYVAGDAAATGLPAGQAALVYAAQAFHYFPLEPTLLEWRRLLAPGGACAAFWYRLARSPLKEAFQGLRARHAAPAAASQADRATRKAAIVDALRARPEVVAPQVMRVRDVIQVNRDGFRQRLASSSALAAAVEGGGVEAEVDALFERFADGGVVSLGLKYTAVVWRFG